MIKFGTLEGFTEELSSLRYFLKALGPSGSITLSTLPKKVDLEISETVGLEVSLPLTIDFQITDNEIFIEFDKNPKGKYRLFKKDVSYLTITMERVVIGLDWSPDGYLEIIQ